MSFLSLNDVSDSFVTNCKQNFSSPDWGVICILHTISSRIIPGQSYEIDKSKLGDKLNELFTFVSKDSRFYSIVYATFSNTWLESFFGKFDNKLSLLDLAIWYYRKTDLPNTINSGAQLIDKFVADLHLPMDKLSEFVNTSSDKSITLNNSLYSDDDLLEKLSDVLDFKITKDSITLKAEGGMVVKCASDFGAGPFTQTLYASKGFSNILLLTDFELSDLYSDKKYSQKINRAIICPLKESYSIEELAKELRTMYDSHQTSGIHLFGIKFGEFLFNDINLKDLCTLAGISENYYVELNKMRNVYKNISDKEFGVCFYEDVMFEEPEALSNNYLKQPLQQIFYGAPGTGKSYAIDNMADDERTVRTTFHPDSDYASFVGAYKPTMEDVPINSIYGESVQFATGKNGHPGTERKIVYKYVPQAFLKAYVEAWKDLDNPHYLVIEEINRGNCAQIFGDLFQLLDRNAMGCSSYAIHADDDIRQFLASDKKGFAGLSEEQAEAIRSFVLVKDNGTQKHIGEQILNGEQMLLPPNLHIWATMNTSDQSLFPIDSAFKRRWNWKFVPINYEHKDWLLHIGDSYYRWGDFLKKINPIIFSLTESSDKQMGYFFAKPDEKIGSNARENNTISEDIFLNKVLFFIWTDILKDFDAGKEPFINPETGFAYEFSDFFNTDKNRVAEFIAKEQFRLEKVEIEELDINGEDSIKNGFKALVNGIKFNTITSALHQILLAKANEYTYDGLKSVLSNCISRDDEFIKTIPTVVGYEKETRWYGKPLTSSDNISFIITNQWNKSFIPQIKELAETLGVTFEELGE